MEKSISDYNYVYKSTSLFLILLVVLVGDVGVGKSHIVERYRFLLNFRYVNGRLPANKTSTIGVEFSTKNIELKQNKGIVKAQIWDTAG